VVKCVSFVNSSEESLQNMRPEKSARGEAQGELFTPTMQPMLPGSFLIVDRIVIVIARVSP
jgi:hypothetical protein